MPPVPPNIPGGPGGTPRRLPPNPAVRGAPIGPRRVPTQPRRTPPGPGSGGPPGVPMPRRAAGGPPSMPRSGPPARTPSSNANLPPDIPSKQTPPIPAKKTAPVVPAKKTAPAVPAKTAAGAPSVPLKPSPQIQARPGPSTSNAEYSSRFSFLPDNQLPNPPKFNGVPKEFLNDNSKVILPGQQDVSSSSMNIEAARAAGPRLSVTGRPASAPAEAATATGRKSVSGPPIPQKRMSVITGKPLNTTAPPATPQGAPRVAPGITPQGAPRAPPAIRKAPIPGGPPVGGPGGPPSVPGGPPSVPGGPPSVPGRPPSVPGRPPAVPVRGGPPSLPRPAIPDKTMPPSTSQLTSNSNPGPVIPPKVTPSTQSPAHSNMPEWKRKILEKQQKDKEAKEEEEKIKAAKLQASRDSASAPPPSTPAIPSRSEPAIPSRSTVAAPSHSVPPTIPSRATPPVPSRAVPAIPARATPPVPSRPQMGGPPARTPPIPAKSSAPSADDIQAQIDDLQKQLQQAINDQAFENCGPIRDKINQLKKQQEAATPVPVLDQARFDSACDKVKQAMGAAIATEDYEKCAKLRDKTKSLESLKAAFESAGPNEKQNALDALYQAIDQTTAAL
eukprot:CAMPEP_0175180122 /NCGR_PEP_ID=MMETSP0087-20121206/35895_1 /TAXON_ID=136419 /ORGANISM="Unknown Unknown, Strain D1" /LENGTH=613 /DNA_ID=CAMNT_0016472433 /DNA_START=88 /DNA_END=1929 /DNA_ORIENTATION=-